jgi:hypothetical protein
VGRLAFYVHSYRNLHAEVALISLVHEIRFWVMFTVIDF